MAAKYKLKVTAGAKYTDQEDVAVNTPKGVKISTGDIDAVVHVRIKNFRGEYPPTSPYFTHPNHTKDLYSISFTFAPKSDISGTDLVFGNDFDHSIKDKLPSMFSTAFNYVTKYIDPGLYGDPMADEPYLYGPLLSSVNILNIGEKGKLEDVAKRIGEMSGEGGAKDVLEEGGEGDGVDVRKAKGLPETGAARMKFYLKEENKKEFVFEKGRPYAVDFFNPYLDFSGEFPWWTEAARWALKTGHPEDIAEQRLDFAVKLPLGLHISALSFWDGQALRYVLRNRKTGKLLFAINFALIPTTNSSTNTDDNDNDDDDDDESSNDDEAKNDEFEKVAEKGASAENGKSQKGYIPADDDEEEYVFVDSPIEIVTNLERVERSIKRMREDREFLP